MIPRQFAKFLLVSTAAAAANIGSRVVFSLWMNYPTAITLAFVVGLASAFLLNRQFVFTDPGNPAHHQVLWFVAINLLALVQTMAISLVLANWILPWSGVTVYAETIAHTIGVGVPVLTSYLGHKHLSFRRVPPSERQPRCQPPS